MARDFKPVCDKLDCFANKCTLCEILTDYPRQPCPFYQTDAQVDDGRIAAHNRLFDMGRHDLIYKYEYNRERKW